MPFSFKPLSIPEVVLVEPAVFPDDRGFFLEAFKVSDFAEAGLPTCFVQDNVSFSKKDERKNTGYLSHRNPALAGRASRFFKRPSWDEKGINPSM